MRSGCLRKISIVESNTPCRTIQATPQSCQIGGRKVSQSATFFAEAKAARNHTPVWRERAFERAAGAAVPRAQESAKTEKCAGGLQRQSARAPPRADCGCQGEFRSYGENKLKDAEVAPN